MSSIHDKISMLNEILSQEATSFDLSQKMQFEWLQTIMAQIDFYSKEEDPTNNETDSLPKQSNMPIDIKCSPKKESNTPIDIKSSPTKQSNIPIKQAGSPIKQASSSIKQVSSPMKSNIPIKQTNSPMKTANHVPVSEKTENQERNYDLTPKKRNSNEKRKMNQKCLSPTSTFSRGSQKIMSPVIKNATQNKNGQPGQQEQLHISSNLCATSPCFQSSNGIKFVEEDSMLMDSSSMMSSEANVEEDESEDPVPFTVSGSMRELTQSASSFREKWIEMLHQKKAATNIPKKPFKFAFDDIDEEMPENYQISDDSDRENEDDDDDIEMYERNPVEIHGKTIPVWARGDQLLKQLKRQQRIDPDSIFLGFTADCPLTELFGTNKARWVNRQDSGWCEADIATDEEVTKFKAALGLQ